MKTNIQKCPLTTEKVTLQQVLLSKEFMLYFHLKLQPQLKQKSQYYLLSQLPSV